MKSKYLKLKTKEEKKTVTEILNRLVVSVRIYESLPKERNKEKRKWADGVIFGMKHMVINITEMLNEPVLKQVYGELIEWDKEEEKFFGKERYKKLLEIRSRTSLGDNKKKTVAK